jgi:hypothetical protein
MPWLGCETQQFSAHKAVCRVNATQKDSMCMQAYQQDVFDGTHTLYSNCKEKQHGCVVEIYIQETDKQSNKKAFTTPLHCYTLQLYVNNISYTEINC